LNTPGGAAVAPVMQWPKLAQHTWRQAKSCVL